MGTENHRPPKYIPGQPRVVFDQGGGPTRFDPGIIEGLSILPNEENSEFACRGAKLLCELVKRSCPHFRILSPFRLFEGGVGCIDRLFRVFDSRSLSSTDELSVRRIPRDKQFL